MAYNPQNPNGSATSANSAPVVVASDQSAIKVDLTSTTANSTAVKVDNSGVTQPVSGTVAVSSVSNLNINGAADASSPGNGLVSNALNEAYNGTTWDRVRTANSAKATTGTGLLAAGALGFDGTNYQAIKTSSTGVVSVDGSAVTQPVSGTVTANAGTGTFNIQSNASVNVAQMNGIATSMGNGVTDTGTQKVTLSSDSTGQVKLATGANTIGALTANQSVNVAQMNGVATTMGNGVAGTGVQRVAIASDNTAFSVNATPKSATSGGLSMTTLNAAASTNGTNVKASAGTLYAVEAFNNAAYDIFLKFYNLATTPTVGTSTIVRRYKIPAGGGVVINYGDIGVAFGTGIAFATTKLQADADTTALVAGDLHLNVNYA